MSLAAAGALSGSLASAAQGLDAGQRDGQLSIVPESSPDRAGRSRVRRSRPLGATPATDPSTMIEAGSLSGTVLQSIDSPLGRRG